MVRGAVSKDAVAKDLEAAARERAHAFGLERWRDVVTSTLPC